MKKLPILSMLVIVVWGGFALWQPNARAWQAEDNAAKEDAVSDTDPEPADSDAPDAEPEEPEPDPEIVAACVALLQQSRDRLYDYSSVQARITERAMFGTRRFTAEGVYISGVFPQMRLEYTVRIGGSEGKLIEVCDGQILRSSKEIRTIAAGDGATANRKPDEIQVTRKEVQKILQASKQANEDGGSPEAIVQAELGLGGLPTLLAALETTMLFDALREESWKGRPYTVIQGRWKDEYLKDLGPRLGPGARMMAPYMPELVRVYFDKETLFPTRILYLKRATVEPVTYRAILAIEFSDVRFDEEIDPEVFRYIPPEGVNEIDETAAYLRLIEAMRAPVPNPPASNPEEPADQTPEAAEAAP